MELWVAWNLGLLRWVVRVAFVLVDCVGCSLVIHKTGQFGCKILREGCSGLLNLASGILVVGDEQGI